MLDASPESCAAEKRTEKGKGKPEKSAKAMPTMHSENDVCVGGDV